MLAKKESLWLSRPQASLLDRVLFVWRCGIDLARCAWRCGTDAARRLGTRQASWIVYAPINVKPEGGDPGHMWGI